MSYILRPYQKDAVDATLTHFRKSRDPALIVLPTGAGKSLLIAELARIALGRVLVLTHVKELVEQNHSKYTSYNLTAGIYSAGLGRKEGNQKVIFGGIQSVANAPKSFFSDFSLLIIDECHRISQNAGTQYAQVIKSITEKNPTLCVLGLTATPYRLESGWVYQYHCNGTLRSERPLFFKKCLYELPLKKLISDGYLTPPVQIDAPVASYDFRELIPDAESRKYPLKEIEAILKDQARITPVIVKNIVELAQSRNGVLIFTASVAHAQEILQLLPKDASAMVLGETESTEREKTLLRFKAREIKYLVNVSVLTTGFDAPHVDIIAILRPTESVGLYQQIVGRGLRLFEGKKDCLILDYTSVPHDIFAPQIHERKPIEDAVPVSIECPSCHHENQFWGVCDSTGQVVEHFGKKCQGAKEISETGAIVPCGFRYRFQLCEKCGSENDLLSGACSTCGGELVSEERKISDLLALKDTHVMRPDSMTFERKKDSTGRERLEVRYYDLDGQHLSEIFFFDSPQSQKVFYYNFERMHHKTPGRRLGIGALEDAIEAKENFRVPAFIISRKQGRYWKIREKVFRG